MDFEYVPVHMRRIFLSIKNLYIKIFNLKRRPLTPFPAADRSFIFVKIPSRALICSGPPDPLPLPKPGLRRFPKLLQQHPRNLFLLR